MFRCKRCPRCGGWLYVEADKDRLDDYYIACLVCGWEAYLGRRRKILLDGVIGGDEKA